MSGSPFSKKKFIVCLLVGTVVLIFFAFILSVYKTPGAHNDNPSMTTDHNDSISYPLIPDQNPDDFQTDDTSLFPLPEPLAWEPVAISDHYKRDDELLVFASIHRPVFSGLPQEIADEIHNTLSTFCASFVNISSEDRLMADEAYGNALFGFETYERAGDFTIYVRGYALSVLYQLSHDDGGADTRQETKAFVFHLGTGKLLSFADYIGTDDTFGRSYIMSVIRQVIQRQPDSFYTDALELLSSSISLYDYYLNEDALILFFNPDVLAPSAHGQITVEIPYSELSS